jgi:hypothetical protein
MADGDKPKPRDMNEPVKIDLDPDEALRALLEVEPEVPVPQDEPLKDQGDKVRK